MVSEQPSFVKPFSYIKSGGMPIPLTIGKSEHGCVVPTKEGAKGYGPETEGGISYLLHW